jgi:hypothetical protein
MAHSTLPVNIMGSVVRNTSDNPDHRRKHFGFFACVPFVPIEHKERTT